MAITLALLYETYSADVSIRKRAFALRPRITEPTMEKMRYAEIEEPRSWREDILPADRSSHPLVWAHAL